MNFNKTIFLVFIFIINFNTINAQHMTPSMIAQGQLESYNLQNIDDFLSWYADDVEVYNFPNELVYKGLDEMRKRYTNAWKLNPNQKATVTDRISVGNTVMDKEIVTGRANGIIVNVIAIYKIENDKITQVYFVRE